MKVSAKSRRAKPRRTVSNKKKATAPSTAKHGATPDANVVSFGRRYRNIREHADVSLKQIHRHSELPMVWLSRVETGQQALNPDRFADWRRILAMVNSLRSLSDSLDDPRDVYRLVSLLGRPVTIEDMRDMCSDVALQTIEKREWLTWPSTMPLLKQPAVMRETEWAWLWDHAIPTDDIVRDKASTCPRIDAAILGAPAVGKSTLVQMFGVNQAVAAHFPDGVLYASQQTADARVWLARWAEQYGLDLPESGQTVLWRDALRVKLDQQTIDGFRGALPIGLRAECGFYPDSAVIRLVLSFHDQPKSPYVFDVFLNVMQPMHLSLLRMLQDQATVEIHFLNADNCHALTKSISYPAQNRHELSALVDRAIEHNCRLSRLDFAAAKTAMLRDRPL